jgi:hypothetical protein
MARTKSTSVDQILKGISLLKEANQSWPEGASHPLISEVLRKAESQFQEELYQALSGSKANSPGEGTRRSKKE